MVCRSLGSKKQGRPISPRLQPRSSRFVRVTKVRGTPSVQGSILGVQNSEELWFQHQGRPISPRLHPRRSRVVRVMISKSREPNQSKAPPSEFKVCKSFADFKNRGAPSVQGSSLEHKLCESSDLAPHQSKAPRSEFEVRKSSDHISPRLHPRRSRFVRFARVLVSRSGAPHQSKAPSSEFKFGKRPDSKTGAPHQSKVPPSEFKGFEFEGFKSSDFMLSGARGVSVRCQDRATPLRLHVRIRAWALALAPRAWANVASLSDPIRRHHLMIMWRQQFGVTT